MPSRLSVAIVDAAPADKFTIWSANTVKQYHEAKGDHAWIRVGPCGAVATAQEERSLSGKRCWKNLPFDVLKRPLNIIGLSFSSPLHPAPASPPPTNC